MSKWTIIGAVWLWFAIALLTHQGSSSPYSYAGTVLGGSMPRISGQVVNHDAPSVVPVTRFFYDASQPDLTSAHNLKLPLHSFLAAAAAGILRSYILANLVVNLLAIYLLTYAVVTLAQSLDWPPAATFIAALTSAFLPLYTHYIGQPMHYVVGIATNFLVMLLVMAGVRDPLRLGVLTAILTLSYDPYVFIGALLAWIIVTLRWNSLREWAVFVAAALAPVFVWRSFLGTLGSSAVSTKVRETFVEPVIAGWLDIILEPVPNLLMPFITTHVGLLVSLKMTLALIYWPVLVLSLFSVKRSRLTLPVLLTLVFILEQSITAGYDWEINPRRAIPVLFAASCAYFVVVREKLHVRQWRIAFIVVMALSGLLTVADSITGNPVVGYMLTGEAMRAPAKDPMKVAETRLERGYYPKLMHNELADLWDMPRARVTRPFVFTFANVFIGIVVVALLFLLRERELLPRHLPLAGAILLLVSAAARFF